jgi:hypothetical protein
MLPYFVAAVPCIEASRFNTRACQNLKQCCDSRAICAAIFESTRCKCCSVPLRRWLGLCFVSLRHIPRQVVTTDTAACFLEPVMTWDPSTKCGMDHAGQCHEHVSCAQDMTHSAPAFVLACFQVACPVALRVVLMVQKGLRNVAVGPATYLGFAGESPTPYC